MKIRLSVPTAAAAAAAGSLTMSMPMASPTTSIGAEVSIGDVQEEAGHFFGITEEGHGTLSPLPDNVLEHQDHRFEMEFILPEEWSPKAARRFRELAAGEALDTLSPEEAKELERLDQMREVHFAPALAKDLLRSMEAKRHAEDLIKALEKYVEFHSSTSSKA